MYTWKFLVAAALFSLVTADWKSYRFMHIFRDFKIPQDIVFDEDANAVTITVGDVSKYPGHVSTINFHDFDTGYVAFKDIRKGICLLTTIPVEGPQKDLYSKRRSNKTLPFDTKIAPDVIDPFVIQAVAGRRIDEFCRDYNTYFMAMMPKDLSKPSSNTVNRCHHHCIGCFLWIECDTYKMLL